MSGALDDVLRDVREERARQDNYWGGVAHDDGHSADDWIGFIEDKVAAASEIGATEEGGDARYRRRMVQIAALAVAAVEALDRHVARG